MTVESALEVVKQADARETTALAAYIAAFDRYYVHRDTSHDSWTAMKAAESEKRKARIAQTKANKAFKAALRAPSWGVCS